VASRAWWIAFQAASRAALVCLLRLATRGFISWTWGFRQSWYFFRSAAVGRLLSQRIKQPADLDERAANAVPAARTRAETNSASNLFMRHLLFESRSSVRHVVGLALASGPHDAFGR
jgi:hypothetical protein